MEGKRVVLSPMGSTGLGEDGGSEEVTSILNVSVALPVGCPVGTVMTLVSVLGSCHGLISSELLREAVDLASSSVVSERTDMDVGWAWEGGVAPQDVVPEDSRPGGSEECD